MKFLVDMPLSPALAAWLRGLGHDAVHASERGLHDAPDEGVMAGAEREGRVIVTADLDYPRLLALARAAAPGVVLFRDGEWGEDEVRARLTTLLAGIPEADLQRSIVIVERSRVRRRRLPLN